MSLRPDCSFSFGLDAVFGLDGVENGFGMALEMLSSMYIRPFGELPVQMRTRRRRLCPLALPFRARCSYHLTAVSRSGALPLWSLRSLAMSLRDELCGSVLDDL